MVDNLFGCFLVKQVELSVFGYFIALADSDHLPVWVYPFLGQHLGHLGRVHVAISEQAVVFVVRLYRNPGQIALAVTTASVLASTVMDISCDITFALSTHLLVEVLCGAFLAMASSSAVVSHCQPPLQ